MVIPLLIEGDDSKQLTETQFGLKLKEIKNNNNINLLSTSG